MDHPPLSSRHLTAAHCSNLRHKGMFVLVGNMVQPGTHDQEDFLGTSSFWCECTQKAFGPDGEPANARDCLDGRKCCEH
jgi:hypothetical protein